MHKFTSILPLQLNHEKLINYMIIGYAFSIAISKAGTSFFSLFMILFWLLEGNFSHKYKVLKENKLVVFLSLFILFSILSILWSDDKAFALSFVNKYWHFIIILIIITSLKKEYLKHVISAFLIAMLFSEIMSYGIFFELWQYKDVTASDPTPFMDHVAYSTYLAFTAILLLNRSFFEQNLKYKLLYIIYFTTVTANLFLNGGRTGQFIFIFSLFLVLFFNFKHKLLAFLVASILGLSIVTLAYSISPVFKDRITLFYEDVSNMIAKNDYSSSFSSRVALCVIGTNTFKDNIFLGTGIGAEMKQMHTYGKEYTLSHRLDQFADYHNSFVQYAVQLGVIGLLLFTLIFYGLYKSIVKDRQYRNLNIIFISMVFMQSLVGFNFHIMDSMTIFALFIGIFGSIYKYEQGHHNKDTL